MPRTIELTGLDGAGRHRVGNKAWRLAALARAGLNVPPARVLPADVPLTPAAEEALGAAWEALGGVPLAVRSSCTHEDRPGFSLAGRFRTTLGVASREDLLEAVRACRASLEHAPAGAAMAVILQALVPAETAGVLFTLNPLTGREEEMLVEAAWGLGEPLVSGEINPDRVVLDFWEGRIREAAPGDKRFRRVPAPGGLRDEPVADPGTMALDRGQLEQLARLGRLVQGVFGYPQDVEWAFAGGRFHLLQSRPITAWRFAPGFGQWSSANFREVMPGFTSILSQSMAIEHEFSLALEESFRRLRLWRRRDAGTVWARSIFGHAYWNVGATKRVVARLPGFRERAFDRTVGIEPRYAGDGRVTGHTPAAVLGALPTLLALRRQYRTLLTEAKAYTACFERDEPAWEAVDPRRLDDRALAERVAWAVELHARANRWALLVSLLATQAQDDFQVLLGRLNARMPDPVSEARLLTGLSGVATVRPVLELWRLSRLARAAGVRSLADQPPDGAWAAGWQAFLRSFRYLADVDEDLACPRWDEDPRAPLGMLEGYLASEEDPAAAMDRQRAVREEEAGRVWRCLGRGPRGAWQVSRFRSQYELVKAMCWWREETRVYLSRARHHTRRVLVEQGKRWAEAGITVRPDDIFWLTRSDLLALAAAAADPAAVRARVGRHRELPHLYRNFRPPLAIDPGLSPGPSSLPAGRVHQGLGCSAGVGVGPARILRSLEDAGRLKRGEVLVAPAANPAWIPLFGLAAAIVLEEGGLLSHSAVVAREMGVPAVLQVTGATTAFGGGTTLRVDGLQGVVEVLGPGPPPGPG